MRLLKKKEEKDSRKWKDIPFSLIWRINITKQSFFQKLFTDIMQSQSKFPSNSSQKWKSYPKIYMELQKKLDKPKHY